LWDFPRYLSSGAGIATPGWQRERDSTKVLSAEGWQSFWMTWLPLHTNGTISAARLSLCFSLKSCKKKYLNEINELQIQ
jgi:hypothetical protein